MVFSILPFQQKLLHMAMVGVLKLGRVLWEYYTEAAMKNEKHYNVIEILWGSGPIMKHAWTGIKTAKVVKSFHSNYGLKIEDIHGIGFR